MLVKNWKEVRERFWLMVFSFRGLYWIGGWGEGKRGRGIWVWRFGDWIKVFYREERIGMMRISINCLEISGCF